MPVDPRQLASTIYTVDQNVKDVSQKDVLLKALLSNEGELSDLFLAYVSGHVKNHECKDCRWDELIQRFRQGQQKAQPVPVPVVTKVVPVVPVAPVKTEEPPVLECNGIRICLPSVAAQQKAQEIVKQQLQPQPVEEIQEIIMEELPEEAPALPPPPLPEDEDDSDLPDLISDEDEDVIVGTINCTGCSVQTTQFQQTNQFSTVVNELVERDYNADQAEEFYQALNKLANLKEVQLSSGQMHVLFLNTHPSIVFIPESDPTEMRAEVRNLLSTLIDQDNLDAILEVPQSTWYDVGDFMYRALRECRTKVVNYFLHVQPAEVLDAMCELMKAEPDAANFALEHFALRWRYMLKYCNTLGHDMFSYRAHILEFKEEIIKNPNFHSWLLESSGLEEEELLSTLTEYYVDKSDYRGLHEVLCKYYHEF